VDWIECPLFIYFDFCLTTIRCHAVQGMLCDICPLFILKYLNLFYVEFRLLGYEAV
jgi:hypothetical protein